MSMSNRLSKLYLADAGIVSPIGIDMDSMYCAWQAGISSYAESAVCGQDLLPLILSLVPQEALIDLDADEFSLACYRDTRAIQLSCQAIQQLDVELIASSDIPLFLSCYEELNSYAKPPCRDFLSRIQHHSGVKFNLQDSRIFATGRASGAHAMEYAFKYMEATGKPFCLVGGVDTYFDLLLLKHLDLEGRIKKAGAMDAFAPGEGSAVLLLSANEAKFNGTTVKLRRPGLAEEAGHRYSDETYKGEALAGAISAALTYTNGQKVTSLYSSANGESFCNKEFGVAMIRLAKFFDENCGHEHPADCYGDIGAASIATLLALAAKNKEKNALIVGSSDASYRGAIKLECV